MDRGDDAGSHEAAAPSAAAAADGGTGPLSRLLAELAASPERDVRAAWGRRLVPGATVGRFELVRELGRGGFGVVFEARDRELKRLVAFKAIRPRARRGAEEEALLRREADAVAALSHPAIVTIHDVGRSEDGPYLILELLRGETLAQRLQRGPLPAREAVRLGAEVARALVHAHARGVLHRDLKPSNVFLTHDGRVKVLDFGLAHVFGAGGPSGSGTPGYMAPEQARGDPEDARTDLYALGVLLHEAIAGARTAAAPPRRLAARGVPAALSDLVARLLDPDPGGRPRDAAEAVDVLARAQRRRARRAATIALAAAVLVAAVAVVAVGAAWRMRRDAAAPAPPPGADTREAYRHLALGEQCMARPAFGQDCSVELRRAAALDPTLPAAHLALAVWSRWFGGSVAAQRAEIGLAVRHLDRARPDERMLVDAWAAHLDGREDEALATLAEMARRWPSDPRPHYEAADLLRHRDELARAIPELERVAELDPDSGWAAGDLAESLGALGRREELARWVARWEAAPSPAHLHGVAIGRGWLGDVAGSIAAAQQGVAIGSALVAQEDLGGALVFAGRYDEVEPAARALAGRGSAIRPMGFYGLAAVDAYRGRRREALRVLDALRREIPAVDDDANYHGVRADHLVGDGDAAPVWREAEALRRIDPRAAAGLAPSLAWLGDAEHAAMLAKDLPPGSILARTWAALARWDAGDRDGALAALAAVTAETPVTVWRVAPAFFLADLGARAGRDADALRALDRLDALYLPRTMWRSWTHPRALVLAAECAARLGERDRARASLDRFFREWKDADPADPLLARARALRARLGRR